MENVALPVLTEACQFRQIAVGEGFYFPGIGLRCEKITDQEYCLVRAGTPLHSSKTICYASRIVWRRIEP